LIVAMAGRLRADGVPLELSESPDLTSTTSASPPDPAGYAAGDVSGPQVARAGDTPRDLVALAADERYWPALLASLDDAVAVRAVTEGLDKRIAAILEKVATLPGIRAMLPKCSTSSRPGHDRAVEQAGPPVTLDLGPVQLEAFAYAPAAAGESPRRTSWKKLATPCVAGFSTRWAGRRWKTGPRGCQPLRSLASGSSVTGRRAWSCSRVSVSWSSAGRRRDRARPAIPPASSTSAAWSMRPI